MLETVKDAIIATLDAAGAFLQTGVYSGDLEELLRQPKRHPSAFVALASGVFGRPKTHPPTAVRLDMEWDVVLFFSAHGKKSASAAAGYDLIETVCALAEDGGLSKLAAGGGFLWPRDIDLVDVTGGVAAYRIGFGIEADLT